MASNADRRMVRLERRFRPDDDVSRMTDDEIRHRLWELLPGGVVEVRQAAEAGDEKALAALAAVREALA